MKNRRLFGFKDLFIVMSCAAMTFFVSGCFNFDQENIVGEKRKLAGCDIDVFKIYKNEIATLKNAKLSENSKEKFEAIKVLLDNVDFEQIYTVKQMENLLGKSRRGVRGVYGDSGRRYRYGYKNEAINIDYWSKGGTVLRVRIQVE
ncbi:hypothetical protein AAEX28_09235 [Lentisphaerota bacterium WC36G]|nr:hypothetical protein LJT99_12080 [Lentisphaerae bacterium WC36]